MKKFERAKPNSEHYLEDVAATANEYGVDVTVQDLREDLVGTPFDDAPPWAEFITDVPGYEPNADAYVYVIALERCATDTRWYYVGEVRGELRSRLRDHTRRFTNQRVIDRDGYEILAGDQDYGNRPRGEGLYVAIGVDRVVPLFRDALDGADNAEWKGYVRNQERQTAFEIAVEYETTHVLGGK